jgi:hypothetical protein
MLPTNLFILPGGHADRRPSRKSLTHRYWVGSDLDRLPTDVHACDTVRVCFEAASDAAEVSPVPAVLARDVSASWTCLACVPRRHFGDRYAELGGFVCECVAEESVGYAICLSSTLAAQLPFPSPELVESLDSNGCLMLCCEVGQLFGEEPGVRADVVALSSTELPEFQSCFTSVSFLISVFLQYGSAVLVSDLPQRDVASEVELLQNPAAPPIHQGGSNAIGVLVYADHILRDLQGRWRLLQQHEEPVATRHQDACSNPTVCQVHLQANVCAVSLDWKPEAFMVRSDAEDRVPVFGRLPAEEPFVKSYCWMFDLRSDLASLPSVPLGFLDELAGYVVGPILRVEEVVELSVGIGLLAFDRIKCSRCKSLEDAVRVLESAVFAVCEWQKVKWQCLLRRYLSPQGNVALTTSVGELAESGPQFLPRINSWVSLRCFL